MKVSLTAPKLLIERFDRATEGVKSSRRWAMLIVHAQTTPTWLRHPWRQDRAIMQAPAGESRLLPAMERVEVDVPASIGRLVPRVPSRAVFPPATRHLDVSNAIADLIDALEHGERAERLMLVERFAAA